MVEWGNRRVQREHVQFPGCCSSSSGDTQLHLAPPPLPLRPSEGQHTLFSCDSSDCLRHIEICNICNIFEGRGIQLYLFRSHSIDICKNLSVSVQNSELVSDKNTPCDSGDDMMGCITGELSRVRVVEAAHLSIGCVIHIAKNYSDRCESKPGQPDSWIGLKKRKKRKNALEHCCW